MQYFHKACILIIQDDEVASIGLVLNRPSPNGIEITVEGKKVVKPIMFGGEFSMKNAPPLVWLHNSKSLKDLGVGQVRRSRN